MEEKETCGLVLRFIIYLLMQKMLSYSFINEKNNQNTISSISIIPMDIFSMKISTKSIHQPFCIIFYQHFNYSNFFVQHFILIFKNIILFQKLFHFNKTLIKFEIYFLPMTLFSFFFSVSYSILLMMKFRLFILCLIENYSFSRPSLLWTSLAILV